MSANLDRPVPGSLPPGWYPDPQAPGELRYWAGQAWGPKVYPETGGRSTSHAHLASPAAYETSDLPVPGSLTPGYYPDPEDPREMRYWTGQAWAAKVSSQASRPAPSNAHLAAPKAPTRRASMADRDVQPWVYGFARALAVAMVLSVQVWVFWTIYVLLVGGSVPLFGVEVSGGQFVSAALLLFLGEPVIIFLARMAYLAVVVPMALIFTRPAGVEPRR